MPGFLLSGDFPLVWQLQFLLARFSLDIDSGMFCQPAICHQCLNAGRYQTLAERGVEEDDVETEFTWSCCEDLQTITLANLGAAGLECLQVLSQLLYDFRVVINHQYIVGSPGECFQTESSTAGKQIKTAGINDVGLQPVKQGFSYSIWSRAQALDSWEVQLTPAPVTCNDAQAVPATTGMLALTIQFSSSSQSRGRRKSVYSLASGVPGSGDQL